MKGWAKALLLGVAASGLLACDGESASVFSPPVGEPPPASPEPPVSPPQPVPDTGPWALDPARGQALFVELCQRCHGPRGSGGYGPALDNPLTCAPCGGFTSLWQRIDGFMPLRNAAACDRTCARDIAAWISNGFSPAASCRVQFVYESTTADGFLATLRIHNFRGLPVPHWRAAFTLPAGHRITDAVDAVLTQAGSEVLLESDGSAGIADGSELRVGLQGTHEGLVLVPADLRLEAPPCFTDPPAM